MKAKALRAQQLLRYTPLTAGAMIRAFDQAWFIVAAQFAGDDTAEMARLTLAECVLAVTSDGDTDVSKIARLALTMFRALERRQQHA